MELTVKYEEIIVRRRALLEEMEERRLQLKGQRHLHREKSQAAHTRNQSLLQELQNMEQNLREAQLPSAQVQNLESRYWACVEESVPAWEHCLLGKGPEHTTDVRPAVGGKHKTRRTYRLGLSQPARLAPPEESKKDSLV
ncbi:centrosomal protein 15 [Eucyclogobius newberryi]|uniref:centrosomal protein 15 n=1 Tax=Eucyclogobius newberryi TaxID=166745 RepID=UPI003B5A5999